MSLQFAGLLMALATFLSIWWGHIGVRWLEAHSANIWPPTVALIVVGVALNVYSIFAPNLIVSGISSIIGITLIWDGWEMIRQTQRIRKMHAPVNVNNPRHAALLAAGKATTTDLLKREPQGYPVATISKQPESTHVTHAKTYKVVEEVQV